MLRPCQQARSQFSVYARGLSGVYLAVAEAELYVFPTYCFKFRVFQGSLGWAIRLSMRNPLWSPR
jgi:hypothetical protein